MKTSFCTVNARSNNLFKADAASRRALIQALGVMLRRW